MTDFLSYLLLSFLIVITPGIDFALITQRTISSGRTDGLKMALGITSGALIHTVAAAFGLSIILMKSALAFEIIKYIGAFYLIYLGASTFFKKKQEKDSETNEMNAGSYKSAFKQGLLSNTLNPKVAIFFLTFLPQFVSPALNTNFQFILMGSGYALLSVLWFSALVFLLGHVRQLLMSNRVQSVIENVTGLVLIGFGARLLFTNSNH